MALHTKCGVAMESLSGCMWLTKETVGYAITVIATIILGSTHHDGSSDMIQGVITSWMLLAYHSLFCVPPTPKSVLLFAPLTNTNINTQTYPKFILG